MSDIGALNGIGNSTIGALVAVYGGASQAAAAIGIPRSTLIGHTGSRDTALSSGLVARLDRVLDNLPADIANRVALTQGNLVHMSQLERQFALIDYRTFPDILESSIRQASEIITRRGRTLPEWAVRGS